MFTVNNIVDMLFITYWILIMLINNVPLKLTMCLLLTMLIAMNSHTYWTHWQQTWWIYTKICYCLVWMKSTCQSNRKHRTWRLWCLNHVIICNLWHWLYKIPFGTFKFNFNKLNFKFYFINKNHCMKNHSTFFIDIQ